jgi:putative copper resistance protein D
VIGYTLLKVFMLWAHLFSAVLFVGGSFFMWLVVVPASHLITDDEAERTKMVGRIAKQFGRMINPMLATLVLTGIFNASWYLPSTNDLFDTYTGEILLVKIILVVVLLALIYTHNVYFGKRIVKFAAEGKLDELKAVRRKSRVVSMANLMLMLAILVLATLMQLPP